MKKRLPLIIVLVFGFFAVIAFMVPHPIIQSIDTSVRNNVIRIITAFSLVLGIGSIIRHHMIKIRRKAEHWPFSYVTLIALAASAVIGLFGGIDPEASSLLPTSIGGFSFHMQTLYEGIIIPLGATMFSLLAFFMTSAAYRAFRARTVEATQLRVAAVVRMLGAVPRGRVRIKPRPHIAAWLLAVPNTAAKRGITFGVGLGIFATSLKILLGIERGWLGGGGK